MFSPFSLSSSALRLSCALSLLSPWVVRGQGSSQPVIMHTGSGSVLSTLTATYNSTANLPGGSNLAIDFGFATAEQPLPGIFADSFTISISGPDGTGYLVTVDANGTQWTPLVPGGLTVADASLQRQSSPFLVPNEGLTSLTSYVLDYSLPANWLGVPLTINFDLFDNQNSLRSLAYFAVPVPEPSIAALLLLSLVVWRFRERFR